MDEIKVSIIVPVYNAGKYLEICLHSLVNQTLKDIEIICIDDASSDNSFAILEKYSEKDTRIILLSNAYNLGQAASKNKGIHIAKGEYIQFVDADDYIEKDAVWKLYELSKKNQLDMCYLGMQNHMEKGLIIKAVPQTILGDYPDVYLGKVLLRTFVENKEFFYYASSVFYHTSFLEENGLFYRELVCGEGGNFIVRCLYHAKRVLVCKEKLYHYRVHAESITHTENAKKELLMGKIMRYVDVLQYFAKDETSQELEIFLDETYKKLIGGIQLLTHEEKVELENRMPTRYAKHILRILCKEGQTYHFDFSEDVLERVRKKQHVIIYGAGYASEDVISLMQENKIEILGFAVTKRKREEFSLFGHHIYEIYELASYRKQALVLVASNKKYNSEIKDILEAEGFDDYIFLNVEI